MTLLNFNIYEVCLEVAGLVSDPLISVVNKIATW